MFALGEDPGVVAAQFFPYSPPLGRGEIFKISLNDNFIRIINDVHNANPGSMRAAIETLAFMCNGAQGLKIAVLGDMLELGSNSPRYHAELSYILQVAGVHWIFTAGSKMIYLHNSLPPGMRGGHASNANYWCHC